MGVPGLWNALREAGVPRSLTSIAVVDGFQSASTTTSPSTSPTSTSSSTTTITTPRPHPRAFRIGIDASIWFVHAEYGKEGENPELRTIFFRLTRLLQVPYLPLFVFDGPLRPAMKRGKLIDTKPNWMIEGLKGMIEAFGFEWRTAPGEAEAELAYLNRIGVIDAVLTDDVDTLVFGARFVIRNQSKNLSGNRAHDLTNADGRDDKNHTMTFSAEDIARHPDISLDTPSLILIALLSGGDYSPGIPGCGISVSASLAQSGFGRSLVEKVQSLSLSISLGLQSSSSSSNGGTSGSRKTKTSKTRVTLGASEKEELLTWLESWREELCDELRTNSRGFLKKRMPTLASRIEREKWVPDLQVLMAYVCPVTSEERAVAKALLSLSSSSFSSSLSSSQTSSVVETAKKQIASELRNQYIWAHDPDIGAIARVCEDRFEWGVREVILKRFRSWLWVGVVCRMLRRASINLDLAPSSRSGSGGEGRGREGRRSTPLPSSSQRTETAKRLESLVMSSPRKGTSRRPLPLSHSPDDSDSDSNSNSNSNEGGKVILKIHSSRTHASTDGLLEYRLEVDPSSFVRAVEEGIEGKRAVPRTGWTDSEDEGGGGSSPNSSDDDDGGKGGKKKKGGGGGGGKKEDPQEPVRMWMPACMVERVVPGLVRDFEERCAKKSSKSKTSSATKAKWKASTTTTAKEKGKAKAPARAKSTTAIPSSSQLSSPMAMAESSDDEDDDSVPMPMPSKSKPRPKVRKAATAPSGSVRKNKMDVSGDNSDDGGGFDVEYEFEREVEVAEPLPSRPDIRAAAPPEPIGMGMAGYFKVKKPGTSSKARKPAISNNSNMGASTSTSTTSTARTSTSTEKKKHPVGSSTARVASLFDDPEVQIFRDLTTRKDRFAPSTFKAAPKPKPAPPPPPPAPASRKPIRTKPIVTSSLGYIEISSDEDVPPKPTQTTTRPALRRIEEDVIDLCSTDDD